MHDRVLEIREALQRRAIKLKTKPVDGRGLYGERSRRGKDQAQIPSAHYVDSPGCCNGQRFSPSYKVDFNHVGWSNLRKAVDVRNRLVHPKRLEDMMVSDDEVKRAVSAFDWLLALVLEVGNEIITNLQEQLANAKDSQQPSLPCQSGGYRGGFK
ncbi:hypothetical protein [Paraburkholderia caribensis]|uniref:hypothetical protein n=1 Tax=Paraburkholderia caribensis TaxID=75105 RepID=UPI00159046EB|nr:hypothetical protein [Paraburkholderia caribensis]